MNISHKEALSLLDPYKKLLGSEIVDQLSQIAAFLKPAKIVHVNSTYEGGGVAEILSKMVPLMNALGLETRWEVIQGDEPFFQCTKMMHNSLQNREGKSPDAALLKAYEETTAKNAERLKPILQDADIVIIHDPQPAGLVAHFPRRKGKWIWRCHIDMSTPSRTTWKYLKKFIGKYDASIFSLKDYVQPLPHPIYLIPPSIDPFSEKNMDLQQSEIADVFQQYHIDPSFPLMLQVSRFDRFKDPLGVIEAYRFAKMFYPRLQLILAGGGAADDPEGKCVYDDVQAFSKNDPDIHVLLLPSNAHKTINALQRGSNIVLQKSIREGFGLTVTEALWKGKPVIGGNTGGIRLQVINHNTGFLVNTPEGAAHRIRYLLQNPSIAKDLGIKGKKLVQENFLITRHLRDYLTLMATLLFPNGDRIDLSQKQD